MPKSQCCAAIRDLLSRHGLPAARLERIMTELSEHWEDLRSHGVEEGLSEREAELQADKQLGAPAEVVRETIAGLRRSSWFGRHPVLAVCALPFLLPPALMVIALLPAILLEAQSHFLNSNELSLPLGGQFIAWTFQFFKYGALAVTSFWLCAQVWKAGLGKRWVLAMCFWCCLTGLMLRIEADPLRRQASIAVGFTSGLDVHTLFVMSLNLLVAAAFCLGRSRTSPPEHDDPEIPTPIPS